jgi:hypothetical protein
VSEAFLNHNSSLFSCPQSILVSKNSSPSFKMATFYSSMKYREWKKLSSPRKKGHHTGAVMITPNPFTGFKSCGKYQLILQLELSDHPAYFLLCLWHLLHTPREVGL